jgi:thiol-disulfide isomerase/thioredoxin/uncharacterized membrane protein YphA (DoxX/SURF4 family)
MTLAGIAVRLFLALVFVAAAIAKVRDRNGTRQAVVDFGVPSRLAPIGAAALPIAELAVAAALVIPATAAAGAAGAAVLLGAFTVAIGVSLARGRTPDCHCFGQVAAGPISRLTVLRNVILVALAVFALVADSGSAVVGSVDPAIAIAVVAAAAFALQAWLLASLVAQNGRLIARLDSLEGRLAAGPGAAGRGLGVGSLAPAFRLPGLRGETLTLDALRAGEKPALLVFADPQCVPCNALMPDLGRWQREHGAKLEIALVTRGDADANRAKATEHGLRNVLLQEDREVAASYLVQGTPSAVLVSPDGRVAGALAEGADAIAALVARTVGVPVTATSANEQCGGGSGMVAGAVTLGEAAPAVRLPDLHGALRDFANIHERTLLLFWNPGCSFCQGMLAELKPLDGSPPAGAPRIVVVSSGSVDANRALGLRSTILLDQDFATGRAFGATGTPSAVLVENGKIASLVAVGAPAVLAVARGERTAV